MFKIVILIFIVLLFSCGKVDPKTKIELEKSKKALKEIETKLENKKSELEKLKNISREDKDKINKKYLLYLNSQLVKFEIEKQKTPNDSMEIKEYIVNIPNEIFSGSKRIVDKKDELGGWYYNKEKKLIEINK